MAQDAGLYDQIFDDAGGYIPEFRLPELDPDCTHSDNWLSLVHAVDPFECSLNELQELFETAPSEEAKQFIQRIADFRNVQLPGEKNG